MAAIETDIGLRCDQLATAAKARTPSHLISNEYSGASNGATNGDIGFGRQLFDEVARVGAHGCKAINQIAPNGRIRPVFEERPDQLSAAPVGSLRDGLLYHGAGHDAQVSLVAMGDRSQAQSCRSVPAVSPKRYD